MPSDLEVQALEGKTSLSTAVFSGGKGKKGGKTAKSAKKDIVRHTRKVKKMHQKFLKQAKRKMRVGGEVNCEPGSSMAGMPICTGKLASQPTAQPAAQPSAPSQWNKNKELAQSQEYNSSAPAVSPAPVEPVSTASVEAAVSPASVEAAAPAPVVSPAATSTSQYSGYGPDGELLKPSSGELATSGGRRRSRRFKKGSREAKEFMARLRAMRK